MKQTLNLEDLNQLPQVEDTAETKVTFNVEVGMLNRTKVEALFNNIKLFCPKVRLETLESAGFFQSIFSVKLEGEYVNVKEALEKFESARKALGA